MAPPSDVETTPSALYQSVWDLRRPRGAVGGPFERQHANRERVTRRQRSEDPPRSATGPGEAHKSKFLTLVSPTPDLGGSGSGHACCHARGGRPKGICGLKKKDPDPTTYWQWPSPALGAPPGSGGEVRSRPMGRPGLSGAVARTAAEAAAGSAAGVSSGGVRHLFCSQGE